MHRYILCICITFAAFTLMPSDAAESHKESLPFKASDIETQMSARYIGPGLIKEGAKVAHTKTLSKRSVAAVEDQCTQRYGCLNCTWARVCAPTSDDTLVEVSRSACPKDRPFCNTKSGSCGLDIQFDCMAPTNVTCFKKEGYIPHPTECKKFAYCSNYTSYLFECSGTNSYNPSTQRCDYYYCYTVNCVGNDGRKVQHPLSNTYYTYCSGGIAIGFDRCLGNDILNTTSQLCEPNCNYEGLIRDTSDCTKYYKCSYEWFNTYRYMVRKRLDCEPGYSFNPEEFQCVKGVPEKGCIQSP